MSEHAATSDSAAASRIRQQQTHISPPLAADLGTSVARWRLVVGLSVGGAICGAIFWYLSESVAHRPSDRADPRGQGVPAREQLEPAVQEVINLVLVLVLGLALGLSGGEAISWGRWRQAESEKRKAIEARKEAERAREQAEGKYMLLTQLLSTRPDNSDVMGPDHAFPK